MPGILYHPQLGPCTYSLSQVSDDPDTQVSEVISLMRGYSLEDARSGVIAADCALARQYGDPVSDTWSYLARRGGSRGMTFQRDEITAAPVEMELPRWQPVVEALIRPADQALLGHPIGDCDDFAMYGAALLTASGVPCSFVTIAADRDYPQMFSHVYLAAYPKSGPYAGYRVPMDLSHGWNLGWEHNGAYRLKEWPVKTRVSWLGAGVLAGGAYLLYKAVGK